MRLRILLLSLLATLPSAANGQGPPGTAGTARPNIVFVLIDDLRWDELGCVGHPFLKTPNIDRHCPRGSALPQCVHDHAAVLSVARQLPDGPVCAHARDHRQR